MAILPLLLWSHWPGTWEPDMAFNEGHRGSRRGGYLRTGNGGRTYVEYKSTDELRRLMTPNGKIYSRKRLGLSAKEQRMVSRAIRRARYMALLPYTSATL